MYLQFLDNVACISWENKEMRRNIFVPQYRSYGINCSPPRQMSEFKVREGYKIAAILKYVQIYQIENSNF